MEASFLWTLRSNRWICGSRGHRKLQKNSQSVEVKGRCWNYHPTSPVTNSVLGEQTRSSNTFFSDTLRSDGSSSVANLEPHQNKTCLTSMSEIAWPTK